MVTLHADADQKCKNKNILRKIKSQWMEFVCCFWYCYKIYTDTVIELSFNRNFPGLSCYDIVIRVVSKTAMGKKVLCIFLSSLMIRTSLAMITTHFKCRGGLYPRSSIERFPVPDDKVSWSVEYKEYTPNNHTSPAIHGKPWADPEVGNPGFNPKWNSLDGNVSRASYTGEYKVVDGYPQNPIGRTGIVGRGVLGRWGPNHAADPVVTRWKRLQNGEVAIDTTSNKPILQFVAIRRGDTGDWALPGGMVDPGEKVTVTAVREFQEEATNALVMSDEERKEWGKRFHKFFSEGEEVFKGYIDDRRNTDNAWMESIAYNFHDECGSTVGSLHLNAGDDAVGVRWVDVSPELDLYASHKEIINEVYRKLTKTTNCDK